MYCTCTCTPNTMMLEVRRQPLELAKRPYITRCHVCMNMATMYCKTCTMCIPHNSSKMVIAVCSITSAHVKVHKSSLRACTELVYNPEMVFVPNEMIPKNGSFQYCLLLISDHSD